MKENNRKTIDKETIIYYYVLKRQYYERYLNTVHEEQSQYEIINNEHDKTYRSGLGNKDEAVKIINKALNLNGEAKIKQEEIEQCSNSFITNQLRNRQADMVYKLKGSNIFILIEHQSKADYSMPFRVQEYKLEIVKSVIDLKRLKMKGYELPIVIPIVIYTGKEKWKVGLELEKINEKRLQNIELGKYYLLDMNKYTKEELLNSNMLLDKIFLLERLENETEIIETIQKSMIQLKDEARRQKFIDILLETQQGKIDKKKLCKIIKEMQGGEEHVVRALDIIRENGIQQGIKMAKEEAKEEMMQTMEKVRKEYMRMGKQEAEKKEEKMVRAMKANNLTLELIQKITGLTKDKIEKIN